MGNLSSGDDIFFTVTMAEILEDQGHFEDALMIYKILADSSPWDETLTRKIESLKELAGRRRHRAAARGGAS
jgi:hypothetical protein